MRKDLFRTALVFVFSLLTGLLATAQSQERIYLDETMHRVATPEEATYYQTIVREGNIFVVRIYYSDGQLKMRGSYRQKELTERDGLFTYYFPNGNKESEGYYCRHQKCGIWKRWNRDGSSKADRIYADPESIYQVGPTEKPAQFPGGYAALVSFVQEHTLYPEEALRKEISGTVKISFRIDEGGLVRDVEVAKSGQYFLDRAALECIWQMPLWTPASREGQTRPSNFIIPIRFSIVDGKGKATIGN